MDPANATPDGERPVATRREAPTSRRRRPSGEPPPLPRPFSASTRVYVVLGVAVVVTTLSLTTVPGLRVVTALDLVVVRALAGLRTEPLDGFVDTIATLGSSTTFRAAAWAILLVLVVFRRFQHLFVALALLLVVPVVVAVLGDGVGRMRPAGVEIIGAWEGFAYPSRPVAEIALVATLGVAVLVPPRWRSTAARLAIALVATLAVARLYLGVDHPSDAAAGLVVGAALPLAAIRLVTPEETVPVSYRRGVRAHLDLGGRRGDAIRRAFARQLGWTITDVQPFRLTASAGSTPMRLVTESGTAVFGKLYAANHLRSDRWYKLGRTIRYGRLEDERPFNSVRRLVQYEDHMLRVLRDAGVPTPEPYGIVQITPEREYVLVTELIPDAVHLDEVELTGADIADDIADQALRIVRAMWDAGLAHRDVKPGNLLVAHGRVVLVDAAFAEIRPSPWREAVDLANMMLTLSLCMPPERVYERALELFSPDEIAEALAASRSVTIPSQLRSLLRTLDADPIDTLRALAPRRAPVRIQRWSVRRFGLTLAVVGAALLAMGLVTANLRLAGLL